MRRGSQDTDLSFELDMNAAADQPLMNVSDEDFPRRRIPLGHKTWWSLLAFVACFGLAMVGLLITGRPLVDTCEPVLERCGDTGCFTALQFLGTVMAFIFLPLSFVPVGFVAQVRLRRR